MQELADFTGCVVTVNGNSPRTDVELWTDTPRIVHQRIYTSSNTYNYVNCVSGKLVSDLYSHDWKEVVYPKK